MSTPKDRLSRFLEHLDSMFQVEPTFFPLDSELPDTPSVVCLVYRDIPEPGSITGFTYGLSEVKHPSWKLGRPELTITVDSSDTSWPLAVAHMANGLRGKCPFCYGDVINFGERIADESEMSAFVIFAPSILEKEEFLGIDVGGIQPINIAGAYPLYDSERDVIARIGLDAFWHHPNFDLYNVRRARVSDSTEAQTPGTAG
jgi:hypothetical protein